MKKPLIKRSQERKFGTAGSSGGSRRAAFRPRRVQFESFRGSSKATKVNVADQSDDEGAETSVLLHPDGSFGNRYEKYTSKTNDEVGFD